MLKFEFPKVYFKQKTAQALDKDEQFLRLFIFFRNLNLFLHP